MRLCLMETLATNYCQMDGKTRMRRLVCDENRANNSITLIQRAQLTSMNYATI